MSKSFDASNRNIGELLGQYKRETIVVPPFQRPYSWSNDQIQAFWDDFTAFRSMPKSRNPYFLGPIVFQTLRDRVLLLDGQQRLATSTVLLSVIRDLAAPIGDEGRELSGEIQRGLIRKEGKGEKYCLTLTEADRAFFSVAVQQEGAVPVKATLRSHKRILDAKRYLHSAMESLCNGKKPSVRLATLKDFYLTLIRDVRVVAIEVTSEDEAYRIFETLNDRGLRLSIPDLLLNYLMSKAGGERERADVRSQWDLMVAALGDNDIDRFFRHMWISKYGDVKARGLFAEMKAKLKSDRLSSTAFAKECAGECADYVAILEQDGKRLKAAGEKVWPLVNLWDAHLALPALLSALRCLQDDDLEKFVGAVQSLVVRYLILGGYNSAKLEQVLFEGARLIRKWKGEGKRSPAILKGMLERLRLLSPSDRELMAKSAQLSLDRVPAKFLLSVIEHRRGGKGEEWRMWKANLEHVFPKNPDVAWGPTDKLAPLVDHLGNLTLLSVKLNNEAANEAFKEKLKVYRQSKIALTRDIVRKHKVWDERSIILRGERLLREALKLWPESLECD